MMPICPSTVRFFPHHYIVGDSYRCVWAIREYPPSTEEQAILSHLADHSGVTLRVYNRLVEPREHDQITNHANRKNRLKLGDSNINEAIQAEQNLLDVAALLTTLNTQFCNGILLCIVQIPDCNIRILLSYSADPPPPLSSLSFFSRAISISLSFSFA